MSRRIAEEVVGYLSLRPGETSSRREFPKASVREWKRALNWLDLSGLALYFRRRLSDNDALDRVPREVTAELERRQCENDVRIATMRESFAAVNRAFETSHIRYTVLKGFALAPDYCVKASLRTQADFDYLIAEEAVESAQRALGEMGYVLKDRKDDELSFWIPASEPTNSRDQYSRRTPWTVELHLAVWDQKILPLSGIARQEFVDGVTMREWTGLRFPSLRPREMFLAQVLHVFRHLIDGWIKLAWLLEIGNFLATHAAESAFWGEFASLVEREPRLAEVTAMVCHMSEELFRPPTPPLIRSWKLNMRPSVRLWFEKYAREFLFQGIPRFDLSFNSPSKLVLLLQEQYLSDTQTRHKLRSRLLFPWHRLRASRPSGRPQLSLRKRVVHRARWLGLVLLYHFGANVRYWWELRRWRRLTKRQANWSTGS